MAQKLGYNAAEKTLTVPVNTSICYCIEDYDAHALNMMLDSGYGNATRMFIPAIKYFRMRFGCGLKEAKDAVEFYEKEMLAEKQKAKQPQVAESTSLGSLLRKKMDAAQTKETTDISGFAQCVFRIIGRGDYYSCTTAVADAIHRQYNAGHSSGFVADTVRQQFDL